MPSHQFPNIFSISLLLKTLSLLLIYVQQDTTLDSLFYRGNALHVSGGATTTHYQERKQLYLQHLVFVTQLLLPATTVEVLQLV